MASPILRWLQIPFPIPNLIRVQSAAGVLMSLNCESQPDHQRKRGHKCDGQIGMAELRVFVWSEEDGGLY